LPNGGKDLGRKYTSNIGGFNSLCILGAWTPWKHRNACVFDGMSPNLQRALQAFKEESLLWRFFGAKGLAALDPGRLVEQV